MKIFKFFKKIILIVLVIIISVLTIIKINSKGVFLTTTYKTERKELTSIVNEINKIKIINYISTWLFVRKVDVQIKNVDFEEYSNTRDIYGFYKNLIESKLIKNQPIRDFVKKHYPHINEHKINKIEIDINGWIRGYTDIDYYNLSLLLNALPN